MATKDFSDVTGRRLRITLNLYHAEKRQFRHVKGVGARVTVRNAAEQKRLWKAIESAIAKGDWRNDVATPDADAALAGVPG